LPSRESLGEASIGFISYGVYLLPAALPPGPLAPSSHKVHLGHKITKSFSTYSYFMLICIVPCCIASECIIIVFISSSKFTISNFISPIFISFDDYTIIPLQPLVFLLATL
jgi:hypothetical protein